MTIVLSMVGSNENSTNSLFGGEQLRIYKVSIQLFFYFILLDAPPKPLSFQKQALLNMEFKRVYKARRRSHKQREKNVSNRDAITGGITGVK